MSEYKEIESKQDLQKLVSEMFNHFENKFGEDHELTNFVGCWSDELCGATSNWYQVAKAWENRANHFREMGKSPWRIWIGTGFVLLLIFMWLHIDLIRACK